MKRTDFLVRSLLLGALSLAGFACGDEELPAEDSPSWGDESPKISISVSAPGQEGVIFRNALTRAGGSPLEDTEAEAAVKTLNVYVFQLKAQGSVANEGDFVYSGLSHSFTATGSDGDKFTDSGFNGDKTCSLKISPELMKKTVKVVVTANDKPADPTKEKTTLSNFKKSVATATVTTDNTADLLVGNPSSSSATGYPMSATAKSGESEAVVLTALGVNLEAKLVRTVARIDVFNDTPNLTITGMEVCNAANKSFLFAQTPLATATSAGNITIKPMSDKNISGGIAYVSGEDKKKANTHRMLYLYEQKVMEAGGITSPYIKIQYKLDLGGVTKSGEVKVNFKKSGGALVDVTRNTLYTVRLGVGTSVSTGLKASLTVDDWSKVDDIEDDISASTKSSANAKIDDL